MKLLFLIIAVFSSFSFNLYGQTNTVNDPNFLDSTDLIILLSKDKARLFELTGAPVDSSLKEKNAKHIFNYAIESSISIKNRDFSNLVLPLLKCKDALSDIPKCTLLLKFCLQIVSRYGNLNIFFSESGACSGIIKVVKVNSVTLIERHTYFSESLFTELVKSYHKK